MSIKTQDTIRQLARLSPNRLAFYQQFLPFVTNQTGAVSAIAWSCSSLPFRPICQIQSPNHEGLRIGVSEADHVELLNRAIQQTEALVVEPKVKNDKTKSQQTTIENPFIILSSVRTHDSIELIELFFPQDASLDVYETHAKTLKSFCLAAEGCELPSILVPDKVQNANRQTPNSHPSIAQSKTTVKRIGPSQLDEYVHQIHRSLDHSDTARQITNEARRVLDCDRVSIVEVKGSRCKIKAISGQPSVNNRSNTVQLLRQLSERVLPTKKAFWYPAEKQLPFEIETPLQEYLSNAVTRSLIVFPIFDQPPMLEERPDAIDKKQKLIGGLIIENCSEEWTQDSVSNAIDIVTRHASDAYRNAHNHRQLLFYPIWKWLGKSKLVVAARNLSKTVAASLALLAAGLLLAFFPTELKVSCDGVLIPAHRQNVFAPIDGTVNETKVDHGSVVERGETLMRMVNIDLESQHAELAGKIKELERSIETTETLLLSRTLADKQNGEQNLNAQKEELASYQRQRELVQKKLDKLNITSPLNGQVVTWNLADNFKVRPVSRGDLLLEVVDVEGDWQLELDLPDQKIGHLLEAHANAKEPLSVEFILAAAPDRKLSGSLIEIGRTTVVAPEQGQTVRLKVSINEDDLDIRQAKSGVTANVICGKTSLGNSMFMGVREFFQKHWFRLF
jgi:multidrug efflux pump subunit AcrA (membrane-fusion protein)